MTTRFTQHVYAALLGVIMFSACSRPVAYVQHSPVDRVTGSNTQTLAVATSVQPFVELTQPLIQVSTTIAQSETYVQKDGKFSTNKTLSKRMIRVRNLLASTTGALSPKEANASHRMNVMEKLVLRKLNKQIGKQLAPNHPEKALISKGKLIGGVVLLIAGLAMLIAGTGTVAFIGLIVGLVGALGVIVGLLGIDS